MKKNSLTSGYRLKVNRTKDVPAICVFMAGGMTGASDNRTVEAVGSAIGANKCRLVVGADLDDAELLIRAARGQGTRVTGYSTSTSDEEHHKLFGGNQERFDETVYTGQDLDSRNDLMVQSAKGVIFLFDANSEVVPLTRQLSNKTKVVGVLSNAVTTRHVEYINRLLPKSGCTVLLDSNPKQLVRRLAKEISI